MKLAVELSLVNDSGGVIGFVVDIGGGAWSELSTIHTVSVEKG